MGNFNNTQITIIGLGNLGISIGKFLLSNNKTIKIVGFDLDKNQSKLAKNSESITIDSKKSHHFFGEISLFNEVDKRTATITATTDCEIAILDDDDIINLCNQDHTLGYKIMKNLAEKLASSLERTNSQVLKLTTVFSLILDN